MPKIRILSLAAQLVLMGCTQVIYSLDDMTSPAMHPPQECTTTELLRDAEVEFNAGRLAEALKIVVAIQPVENEQNVSQYHDYYLDWHDIEDLLALEKNEFHQKDAFLKKLVSALLTNRQSPTALLAALQIGHHDSKNQTLGHIMAPQLLAAVRAVRVGNSEEAARMIDKAFETAAFICDEKMKNDVYVLAASNMLNAGDFPNTVKLLTNMSDRQKRNNFVDQWVIYDPVELESTYQAILSIGDPEFKLRTLYRSTDKKNAASGTQRSGSILHFGELIIDTFNAIETPGTCECDMLIHVAEIFRDSGMNEKAKSVAAAVYPHVLAVESHNSGDFRVLDRAAILFRNLDMSDEAETVTNLFDSLALDLIPAERIKVYHEQINAFERSLPYAVFVGREKMPFGLQEYLDILIRRAVDTVKEINDPSEVNAWLIRLLNLLASRELYQTIHEMFLSSTITLAEDQKVNLANTYTKRHQRLDLLKEEQYAGFKNLLVPLVSDIYANTQRHSRYARDRCVSELTDMSFFLLRDGRVEEWTELIESPGIPQTLREAVRMRLQATVK